MKSLKIFFIFCFWIAFFPLAVFHNEYVISVYQDANNNGRLDYGLFGIPKELVGNI